MSENSRFIQAHPEALIEFIQNDEFFYEDDYSIIDDVKNNVKSFTFSENILDTTNYNKIPNQLYLIDDVINKFGIVNFEKKKFLKETQYVNTQPVNYDKIKIWFPISFTFNDRIGFFINVSALEYNGVERYNFSNFFLDTTIPSQLNLVENDPKPFRLNEILWGKSITILVPSLYSESNKRTLNNGAQLGTINYNLTNGVGLSNTNGIYFDFRFLTRKQIILNETTYITTPTIITTLSQAPEFTNLAVNIDKASDGDYFLINGLYNGSIGEFDIFMNSLDESGKRSYILYTITTFEENIPQNAIEIYVYKDFIEKIDFRPIIKHTNTVASIRVDMKLINSIDSSVITKTTEYVLIGNDVSKYGRFVTPINISNAIKPKLYNKAPVKIALPPADLINSHIKRKAPKKLEIRYVPYPVLTTISNVVIQDVTVNTTNQTYLGFGDLTLNINPFDNIVKFALFNKTTNNAVTPFQIPTANTIVNLIFKSQTTEIRIPLFVESNEVNLNNGIVVFKITSSNVILLNKIKNNNNKFYITLTTNGIESVLYDGLFLLLSETRRSTSTTNLTNQNTAVPINKNNIKTTESKIKAKDTRVFILNNNILNQLKNVALSTEQLKKLE